MNFAFFFDRLHTCLRRDLAEFNAPLVLKSKAFLYFTLTKGVKMEKKTKPEYESPRILLCAINASDLITTSGGEDDDKYTGEWDEF